MQLKENVVTFTDYKSMPNANCLLLDTIGHLSSAYFYGKMAFIGGGFSGKLHNILEPGAYGLPTFYGPLFHKFPEAKEFLAGFWVIDVDSEERALELAEMASAAPGPGGEPLNMPIQVRQVMRGPKP